MTPKEEFYQVETVEEFNAFMKKYYRYPEPLCDEEINAHLKKLQAKLCPTALEPRDNHCDYPKKGIKIGLEY